jgi:hypothetical protein
MNQIDRDALVDYGLALVHACAAAEPFFAPLANEIPDRLAWRMSVTQDAKDDIILTAVFHVMARQLGIDPATIERRPLLPVVEREPEPVPVPVTHVPGQHVDWSDYERRNRPARTRLQSIAGHLGRPLSAEEIACVDRESGKEPK